MFTRAKVRAELGRLDALKDLHESKIVQMVQSTSSNYTNKYCSDLVKRILGVNENSPFSSDMRRRKK